jgi:hypothetical protein
VRAVAIARHAAGAMTWIERALWAAWDVAGLLALCTLLLSNLL